MALMLYQELPAAFAHIHFRFYLFAFIVCCALFSSGRAQQSYESEINTTNEPPLVRITNYGGRVTVTAEERASVALKLAAPDGRAVGEKEISVNKTPGLIALEVAPRAAGGGREAARLDLSVRVPLRAKIEVKTTAGSIDLIGNLASAQATTETGTIRADVPSDALAFKFVWTASRPRVYSELELPPIKERAGGRFEISGHLNKETDDKKDADAAKDEKKKVSDGERVRLDFTTARGVMLMGVADPEMVPTDLRERKLTEAARAIIRSGDAELSAAIRKVSPQLFRDYVGNLPAHKGEAPTLIARRSSSDASIATTNGASQIVRLNVNVTDRTGRAIGDLSASDFKLYENGQSKAITAVEPSTAPFNLVLLVDVSGSVDERLDYIRKAARAFVATASPQDRIAIVSFRDDVQLVSNFTTDRAKLSAAINDIEAGGATAYYDSLAYVLLDTLKPLRGERTAIVVLSDGDDNRSFLPFPALLETITESGAIIYPLYVPSELIPFDNAPQAERTVDPVRAKYLTLTTRAQKEGAQLAQSSGGIFYPITQTDDIQKAYDDIISQLRASYTITYTSDQAARDLRRIRVQVARPDVSVRTSRTVDVPSTVGSVQNR